jgi:hypothetical protein
MNRVSMFIFLCAMLYRVDQPEDRRNDASEQNAGVASIGFFVNVRTFVGQGRRGSVFAIATCSGEHTARVSSRR